MPEFILNRDANLEIFIVLFNYMRHSSVFIEKDKTMPIKKE